MTPIESESSPEARLAYQRWRLPFCAVLLQCLDKDREEIPKAEASGFIRRESGRHYLYTCWHVVTGLDPNHLALGHELPKPRSLRVALQAAESRAERLEVVGGLLEFVLDLYENT